jgi:hypothetical protein
VTSAFGKAYKDEDNRFYTLDIVSKYRSTERGTGRKETVHPQNILDRQEERLTGRKVYWCKHKDRLTRVAGEYVERKGRKKVCQKQGCTKVYKQ